jgi:ATP-dependent helicase HrpB
MSLPIDIHLPAIMDALDQARPVVLKAPPGAGKTTGVPPTLMGRPWVGDRDVWLIQPRRLAARSAAMRLAQQMSTTVGGTVGYQVRFDRRIGKSTRLIAMTTGILLRRIQTDPFLENVAAILLDEFHERSLEMDLSLGMIHRIMAAGRDDLRLMVMSATLDPQPIVDFLPNAVGIETDGRVFPVSIEHLDIPKFDRIETSVARTLDQALQETDGDVLVFLPGVGEIRRCESLLRQSNIGNSVEIRSLYGDQSPEQQFAALATSDRRRVILSTNVAETSVTIDGVTAVIDSGKARVLGFDTRVGLPRLQLQSISMASAQQRAGRAGRTAPGKAYRLWSAATNRGRPQSDLPEILQSDLASARLMLLLWGEKNWRQFPFLTPPTPSAIQTADQLLIRLGAVNDDLDVTSVGQQIARLPLHPRLGRLMIQAKMFGITNVAATVAALLTSKDPFTSDGNPPPLILWDRLARLERYRLGDRREVLNVSAAQSLVRIADQIEKSLLDETDGAQTPTPPDPSSSVQDRLVRCLLSAFPDRLCQRRDAGSRTAVMIGRRGIVWNAHDGHQLTAWFLALDVDGAGTEAKVRLAVGIDRDQIPSERFQTRIDHEFDASRNAVVARRRTTIEDLVVSESPTEVEIGTKSAEILYTAASEQLPSVMPEDRSAFDSLWTRLQFLNQSMPQADLPTADHELLNEILLELCRGRTQFKQLQSGPWYDHLIGRLSYATQQFIETHAPSQLKLPSGNHARVIYGVDGPPRIEVRLQELFGWTQTPRIAGGNVPLQLRLLSPARRVEQITDDLANFWAVTYEQVRKDLRGRYPKHYWPDNPATAKATHNGMKPR